ncbi:MAG: ankyrin repeat domain-containing protein [Anaerolineae bacterium]|nr:ankyrin repeat domain-containing protein [Anaerolineae bacterium]MCL4825335.1 ankyrin repeat domain-containing protein [Anaerolineales bacterium]HPP61767.1 ankyrin repeat domain-containing protein [Anaerolineales bacterium]
MSAEFFEAIRAGDRDQVERLLMIDARLIHERENGLSPVMAAAYQLKPQLAEFLADKTVALTVFEAAAIGRIPHLVRLLARNLDLVNQFAEDGFQPLGLACFFGHLEAAEYLVRAGAAINMPSNNELRVTPLHSAAAGRHAPVVKMLLKHGAIPNVRDRNGCTPLHAAAANGDVESIQLLILHGADIHIRSNDDKFPAQLAEEKGHQLAAEILKREITKRLRPIS